MERPRRLGVGLLAGTSGRLYSSAFYALRNTRTPLNFAVIRVVLTLALGYFFSKPLRACSASTRAGASPALRSPPALPHGWSTHCCAVPCTTASVWSTIPPAASSACGSPPPSPRHSASCCNRHLPIHGQGFACRHPQRHRRPHPLRRALRRIHRTDESSHPRQPASPLQASWLGCAQTATVLALPQVPLSDPYQRLGGPAA